MAERLATIEQEMFNLYAIADDDTMNFTTVFDYIEANYNEVIDLAFTDERSRAFIKDYYSQTESHRHIEVLKEIFDLKKEPFHTEVESAIETFIGDEKNTLLTVSYGFSDYFRQIFPQEKEYLEKTFHQHKKNVILGFEPGITNGEAGWERTHGPKINDIFSVNDASNSSLHYKSRLITLLNRVFGTADVHVKKINDYALMFTFMSRGNDYMFIWVKAMFSIPVILKYYKAVMDIFNHRIMICSRNIGVCKEAFIKYSFYYDYFNNTITTSFGSDNKNIGTFKDEPVVWFQGKIERSKANMWDVNMWKVLGGKRSRRRRHKNRKGRTRRN